ncbi:MAG: hypothetical protein LBV02_04140 [Bacteroidales bacterium]|jgi:glycosyltransferase involved in cell wall biosynthesis|nr:hypothetical protein [Bacteroidales bacterium]
MKIVYLLTAHLPQDERIWYHQKPILEEAGHRIFIITSRTSEQQADNIFYYANQKNKFQERSSVFNILSSLNPQLIICDTPLAILYAFYFAKREKGEVSVVYDVTEFYPSRKNLQNKPLLLKPFKKLFLQTLFKKACKKVDGFIFGEKSKSLKPLKISQSDSFVFSPYYPNVNYFKRYPLTQNDNTFSFFYAGNTSTDKGYHHVLKLASHCASICPNIQFQLHIIAYNVPEHSLDNIDNLKINYLPFLNYPDYCREMGKYDLYLDLREINTENTQCLPIKLFDYMAFGRPVIFSHLDAISDGVPEISTFGYIVDPANYQGNANLILHLLENNDLYRKQAKNAVFLADSKYNWDTIKDDFLRFIQQFQRHESD